MSHELIFDPSQVKPNPCVQWAPYVYYHVQNHAYPSDLSGSYFVFFAFLIDFYMCTYARCPCMRENMTNISSFKSKDRFQNVRIKHCFWQVNQCAACLARMSFSLIADFFIYDSPRVDILDVFEGDLNRMYFNKICHESCFGA